MRVFSQQISTAKEKNSTDVSAASARSSISGGVKGCYDNFEKKNICFGRKGLSLFSYEAFMGETKQRLLSSGKKVKFCTICPNCIFLETYLLYSGKYFNLSRECWWHFATAQNLQLAITQLAITYNKCLRPPLFVSRVDKLKACLSTLSLLHFNYL